MGFHRSEHADAHVMLSYTADYAAIPSAGKWPLLPLNPNTYRKRVHFTADLK